MSARSILNPPLNNVLNGEGGASATLGANTFTGLQTCNAGIDTTSISASTVSGATTISTTPTGLIQCGSASANTYISSPTVYTNIIAPVSPSVITTLTSGAMAVSIFGINGNAGIIASNSEQSPFPAGGTQLSFQTFTNASTAVSALGLTTTTINVGLPIVPSYAYPIANNSAIGYNSSATLASTASLSSNTWYSVLGITIPDNGLWLITAQCLIPTGGNIMSINTSGTASSNPYCSISSSGGTTQCSNVFNLTAGATVNMTLISGAGGICTGLYLVYTRLA